MKTSLCVLALLSGTAVVQAAPVAEPVAAPVVAEPQQEKAGLKIWVGANVVELRRSDPHINVVLQNTSSEPINIFPEIYPEGDNNLTLEITKINGKALDKPLVVTRGEIAWEGGGISPEVIAPGEVLVREVRFHVPKHFFDHSIAETPQDDVPGFPFYRAFPLPPFPDGLQNITMRAVFSNDNPMIGIELVAQRMWTGRIASPIKNYPVLWGFW